MSKLSRIKQTAKQNIPEILILLLALSIMIFWSLLYGEQAGGPDEPMRYDVARWLYNHPGQLPRGDDPSIRNGIWGFSYAFYPILSYMVSAVFMWIVSIFSTTKLALLQAARLAPVLFISISNFLILKTGKKLFGREKGLFFSCLIIFLPGYMFIGTYVNNDSLAMMCAAIILYAWVCVLDEGWTRRNCVILSVGMGLCFLSYYNAYGWILCSFFFYCFTMLLCSKEPVDARFKELIKKGLFILAITFLICGWWFIRNYIIYDGDILGRETLTAAQELYAREAQKPSQIQTPASLGWSLMGLFFYQDPWPHNWLSMSIRSFVGTFGQFNIFMDDNINDLYIYFIALGFGGVLCNLYHFNWHRVTKTITRETTAVSKTKTIRFQVDNDFDRHGILKTIMVFSIVIPVFLYVYYVYFSDLQAQGRYFLSALYPVMYFTAWGWAEILERFIRSKRIRDSFYLLFSVLWIGGMIITLFTVIIPGYTG